MGSGNSACCQSSRQTPPWGATLRHGMSPVAFYIVETFATLLGVILLAVAVLYGGRRLGIGRASGPLELLGRLPLDARRAVYLVKVGKLVYVVGSSEGGLTRLGELEAEAVPDHGPSGPPAARAPRFADVLARLRGSAAGSPPPPASPTGAGGDVQP
jgi:flagellar biogenesis protein FliO